MNATTATYQFKTLLKEILNSTTIKLGKVLMKFLINCVIAIVSIRGRVNFLQLMRYSGLNEKTFRNNFCREVDWIGLNKTLVPEELPCPERRFIAIDPAHISKAGKSTPGVGRYWSGTAGATKNGLEILAIAACDYQTKRTVMLGAEQTLTEKDGEKRSMAECYVGSIRENRDEVQAISKVLCADAFFARENYVSEFVSMGFTVVSRFQSNCVLRYYPTKAWLEERGAKRGPKPSFAGKVDIKNPDERFLVKVAVPGAKQAWSGAVWSNALKMAVSIVIVDWGNEGRYVYFTTDMKMRAAVCVAIYRCRFQIEFGIRDGRQYTGLHHSQARDEKKLDFAFNISFFARNVMATEIQRIYPKNTVRQLKNAISDTQFALRILKLAAPEHINVHILNEIDHMIASYIGEAA